MARGRAHAARTTMIDAADDSPVSFSGSVGGSALPDDFRQAPAGAVAPKEPTTGHETTTNTTDTPGSSGSPMPAAAGRGLLPMMIAGFQVHPLANRLPFPLMNGKDFDQLVESIADLGVQLPVVMHEGMLLEGRNRARAVEVLRSRGLDVDLPTVPWQSARGETPLEFVFLANATRRQLAADQIAVLMASAALEEIRAACAARQKASRFQRRVQGAANEAAALNSAPPRGPAPEDNAVDRPSNSDRFQQSAVGRLATLAGVSRHTAEQAVRLVDDVAAGLVPQEDLDRVLAGEVPLRKVSRRKRTRPPTAARPAVELVFAADDAPLEDPDVSEREVRDRWEKLKQAFAVTDHREVRRIAAAIIAEEQRVFDR